MKTRIFRLVLLALVCGANWNASAAPDTISGNFVAPNPEPRFSVVAYTKLPKNIAMAVRMSSDDVIDAVERKFPQLRIEQTYISLESEELVTSRGKHYRRIRLFNTDSKTGGMHGPCGQWIAVWFSADGALGGVYVGEPGCPL
jgi:hypothetical protein